MQQRRRPGAAMLLPAALALIACVACGPSRDSDDVEPGPGTPEAESVDEPRGLRVDEPGASPGYVLFTPLTSATTYLVDTDGRVVHVWEGESTSTSAYLLDDGRLLRAEQQPDAVVFSGGGQGGRLRAYGWDGEKLWDYRIASEDRLAHHDIEPLPDGNVLAIAWESKTAEEARRVGRIQVPEAGIWPGMVLEIRPEPPDGGSVVWEWHTWDHLIQNVDPELPDYGTPSEHPERIDINGDGPPREIDPEELEQLKALGYVTQDTEPEDLRSDLFHTNAVAYNADLDQIALSTPRFDEIWIIDHSTSTDEASASSGGRWGRGGDLLYRWGNPLAYGRAESAPKQLFGQHDVRWVPEGMPGAGHLTIFNNRLTDADGHDFSTVIEIAPPVDASGRYVVPEAGPFGPSEPVWTYEASDRVSFHSSFISGAHRLPNGNTFVCSGAQGRFFEVSPAGEIVWEYWNPYSGNLERQGPPIPESRGAFRATKILPAHPALIGKELQPLSPQPPFGTREES